MIDGTTIERLDGDWLRFRLPNGWTVSLARSARNYCERGHTCEVGVWWGHGQPTNTKVFGWKDAAGAMAIMREYAAK